MECAGWTWKNCSKALQGIMIGKEGQPSVRMEVICPLDLWIWSFQFALPGAMNDFNILEVSNYFTRVLFGDFPPVSRTFTIFREVFNWFYYLMDGIYPNWKVFAKSISSACDRRSKLYTSRQEGISKCIERGFSVLFRRFKLLFIASGFWSLEKMKWLATACVCMHNMIVGIRGVSY
ncbi:hypothetical protein BWQ96_09960 [Gracilariopsis chorda]|uniref:DDE Tnp4 domain-containing protein n=1 Tax=Gracilariopsis chorda TaxID=448386 RepID=A0A2V3IE11_9FLOR|nr:hypothetical protein BWQ96_09960 [Gracilariopsis chorda]|eukprot:PXF40329.1 hypothetical protein BWQ96_09960 [Gracilariopsis chorda]